MAYNARVAEVLIASPGDVKEERQVVREELYHWNSINTRERSAILMPIGWETDSSADLSGRPQQQINDRLLKHADIVVGIFWNRIGSSTGKAESGSVEEIQEHHKAGKTVMLYFSEVPIQPKDFDNDQYQKLQKFKDWAKPLGLYFNYSSVHQFRDLFRRQLPLTIRDSQYLQKTIFPKALTPDRSSASSVPELSLSDDELRVLNAAIEDPNSMVAVRSSLSAMSIGGGGVKFADGSNMREFERWRSAVQDLVAKGFLRDTNSDGVLFSVTHAGFSAGDQSARKNLGRSLKARVQNSAPHSTMTWQEEDVLKIFKGLNARPGTPVSAMPLKAKWFPKADAELWTTLKKLEEDGIVVRNQANTAFSLTDLGYELIR